MSTMFIGLIYSLIIVNTAAFGLFLGGLFYELYLMPLIESE